MASDKEYEIMSEIDILIGACGSATDLAEIALRVKYQAEAHNDRNLLKCYETILSRIVQYAGIDDESAETKYLEYVLEHNYKI